MDLWNAMLLLRFNINPYHPVRVYVPVGDQTVGYVEFETSIRPAGRHGNLVLAFWA